LRSENDLVQSDAEVASDLVRLLYVARCPADYHICRTARKAESLLRPFGR
jgi:hypothetical protein